MNLRFQRQSILLFIIKVNYLQNAVNMKYERLLVKMYYNAY